MKEAYYYIRNRDNHPIITVCLAKQGQIVSRGMAVCSKKDNVCKKQGRKHARDKVLEAFGTKESGQCIVRQEAIDVLSSMASHLPPAMENIYLFPKSAYNIVPWDDFEVNLIERMGDHAA
jgi:hypothetical protein